MKKASVLFELLISFVILTLLITVLMISYKSVIYRVSLNNETAFLKRFLEYAQDYAITYQVETSWEQLDRIYIVKKDTGEVLKKHHMPKPLLIDKTKVVFNARLKPGKGITIVLSTAKRQNRIVIDPSTGRIRVMD